MFSFWLWSPSAATACAQATEPFEDEGDMYLDQLFRKSHIVDASHLMSCV